MIEPFTIEGYLNLEGQEGGYAGPDWKVDDHSIADDVAEHFGIARVAWIDWEKNKYPYGPGDQPIGQVRLTIERIDG